MNMLTIGVEMNCDSIAFKRKYGIHSELRQLNLEDEKTLNPITLWIVLKKT